MGIMNSLLKQKEMVVKDWLTYYVSVDDPYIFTLKNDHRLMDETGFVLENLFIGMTEDLGKMNAFARELGKAQFITSLRNFSYFIPYSLIGRVFARLCIRNQNKIC